MDVSDSRLAFCKSALGIQDTINVADAAVPAVDRVKSLTGGDMATVVIDATGNSKSMCGALQYLAHGGRLVYVGLFPGDFTLNDPELHKRETTLLGSRNSLPEYFSRIIGMIEAGQIDTSPWITHRTPAAKLVETFPTWTAPN